jgi:hypothetical protein
MTTQMEYLHMQIPIGGLWGNSTMTGVNVKLIAMDPNGNSVDIGTAVTDPYHGTFSIAWTPDTVGPYNIIASFEGSGAYGSSSAATGLVVGAPQSTTAPSTATPVNNDGVNNTIIMAAIGVGAAVIIAVAIATILILRKH